MYVLGEAPFGDRVDAGRQLADRLATYAGRDPVVLAVPRGGIPVGIEVADRLGCGLEVIVPRKIPVPQNPEAGYGAVAEDGKTVLNDRLVKELGLGEDEIRTHVAAVRAEIERRAAAYRGNRPLPSVEGRMVILVDDGLASGYTMAAAVKSLEELGPERKIVAVPVSSGSAQSLVMQMADDLVAVVVSNSYPFAVASFYRDWYDLGEDEVLELLRNWRRRHGNT